ncbi:MAG: YitT family protein [Anaerolineae bacterium]|nr:YitT family protein [Anaerolineae bacterium]
MSISTTRPRRTIPLRTTITNILLMTAGALISALGVVVFMIPAEVVPGGVSSVGVILNAVLGAPVGLVVILGNIPIQYIGARMLGGWRTLWGTVYVVAVWSLAVEVFPLLGVEGVSDDRLLNAVFGGALGGLARGLIYGAGRTLGGTSTLARILQDRTGTPMSTTFLYTDTAFIALAGIVFGWEAALYAVLALVINGMATDYVLEGPSVVRTAMIITNHPDAIADIVIHDLHRTVTRWDAEGMYAHQPHSVLYVTVSRSQARRLKDHVLAADPTAFIVIGQGHAAYGASFKRVRQHPYD